MTRQVTRRRVTPYDAFNPEQLMHELENFLRQEREGRAE